jgi:hypothetical protein
LAAEHLLPSNGTLFITTEDPQVLVDAESWGAANHWTILFTNLFDRSQQTAYKTWDEQHKKGTVATHDVLEYISMILNLQYAIQCEAWVCTLASNSCRIIDELRATIGGKANRFYADLSGETCSNPPCIEDHGRINSFGERKRRLRQPATQVAGAGATAGAVEGEGTAASEKPQKYEESEQSEEPKIVDNTGKRDVEELVRNRVAHSMRGSLTAPHTSDLQENTLITSTTTPLASAAPAAAVSNTVFATRSRAD